MNSKVFTSPTKINATKHVDPAITNDLNHTALKKDKVYEITGFSGDLNDWKDIQDPMVCSLGCSKRNQFDSAEFTASM
jgi:hypothetical protein